MVRRLFCSIVYLLCTLYCFPQKMITVEGEYSYVVPENIDLEKAKQIALDRVKIQLIADKLGTTVTQSNTTFVSTSNENANLDFISIGGSEIKGEWIETIGKPVFKTEVYDEQVVIRVKIKGRIREIVSSIIPFETHVLRHGTDDKFEDNNFRSGDDLYVSFLSPVCGYVVIYLIDNDGQAFCLLPYGRQEQGNVKVNANERYVFFSEKCATSDLQSLVDEYTMTCSRSQELNEIYVIFSPNAFVKAVDNKEVESLPRELSMEDFHKWLSSNRVKDKDMNYKKISITVTR